MNKFATHTHIREYTHSPSISPANTLRESVYVYASHSQGSPFSTLNENVYTRRQKLLYTTLRVAAKFTFAIRQCVILKT